MQSETMHVTPLYAAIFGLLFFALSVRTLRLRSRLKIGVGDAGNPEMLRAMRVHANFAEYVPFSLLLIFMLEAEGARAVLVHALCAVLLVGRLVHAYGVSKLKEDYRFRVFGMASTFTALVGASVSLIALYISSFLA
jgi:uncharacterized membrane protein YecN with MAPEG domain